MQVKRELMRRPTFSSFNALLVRTTNLGLLGRNANRPERPPLHIHMVTCPFVLFCLRQRQNNFAAETGLTEELTKERQAEEIRFLNAVMATPVMKFAHKYLGAKGLSPADEAAFKKQLWDIWFQPYNRTRGVRVRIISSNVMTHTIDLGSN